MNHDDLRALAKAATPGPWAAGIECVYVVDGHAAGDPEAPDTRFVCCGDADARYIAAVSPDVVLGLLDEIERLNRIEIAAVEAALDLDVAMQRLEGAPDNAIVVERAMDDVDGGRHALRAALGTATPSAVEPEKR